MRTMIEIRRPGGGIEQVEFGRTANGLTPALFAKIQEQTRAAGRGEVIRWWIENDAPLAPAVERRREIDRMFETAESHKDYPTEYYPAVERAEKALAEWRTRYPEAAKEERRTALVARVEQIEQQANDALAYNDAGRGRENQEALRAQAQDLRAEAEAL